MISILVPFFSKRMAKDLPQVLLLKEKGTTIGPVF
jgi:hypothetical protein